MFEKLTPRERKLAYGVIALVPITILFMGVFWFSGKYSANNSLEMSLIDRIDDEEIRQAEAKKANRRRAYFDSISLPAHIDHASNEYQIWLKMLLAELKLDLKTLTPRDASDLKFKTKVVGKRKTYALNTSGDLKQLTEFLTRFYSVDLLHRINSIKIIPQSEASSGDKKIRTGKLTLSMTIEVLALKTSNDNPDFTRHYRDLARSNEDYQLAILRRNIFGPANNTPTVSVRPSSSYTSGSDAKITVTSKDADDQDAITYEILESSVEGVTLEPSKPGARTARFTVPGQPAGKYDFKLKVRDNGFPAKESIADFSVTFKDRVIKEPDPPPPPKPDFVNAKETHITGIVLEKTGDWRVWIKVRTTGDFYQLKVGESFELDKQKWTVETIEPKLAVLRVDNRLLTFHPLDRFVNPRHEVTLDLPAGDKQKVPQTDAEAALESDEAPKPSVADS